MKRYRILMACLMVVLLLVVSACSKSDNPDDALKDKAADMAGEQVAEKAGDVAEEAAHQLSQENVNFRCTIKPTQQIFSFLKGDAKITSPNGESWLIADKYYIKVNLGDKDYLVKYEGEESELDSEGMMNVYALSKTTATYECELGVVKESDVTLPDLEIISPEEMGEKMLGDMGSMMPGMETE
ncbi:hypothetical protein JXB31_01250 [Candidatus Woesearchaeota archaeon]|nr:hypothetical protein [Candidatus Woesearchaeota archaeon]